MLNMNKREETLFFTCVMILILAACIIFSFQPAKAETIQTEPVTHFQERMESIELVSTVVEQKEVIVQEAKEVETKATLPVSLDIPENASSFKAWENYKSINLRSSKQYKLQQLAYTDNDGFRRYGEYYMVALGTYYAKYIGQTFQIILDTGVMINVIVGDVKADEHTDALHQMSSNNNLLEMIVDLEVLDPGVKNSGDLSNAGFQGKVISIIEIIDIEAIEVP